MPNFFKAVSHAARIDLSNTKIYCCVLDRTIAESCDPGSRCEYGWLDLPERYLSARKKQALQQQFGVDPSSFYALVVSIPMAGLWFSGEANSTVDRASTWTSATSRTTARSVGATKWDTLLV